MRPNDLPNTTDYHLFKAGVKPVWEVSFLADLRVSLVLKRWIQDNANRRGGKWMVRLKKGLASRYWEEVVRDKCDF